MKARLGFAILTFLPLFAAVSETGVAIGHVRAAEWAAHATFHLLMGLGALLATCGLILVLTWIPLRRGERWAWFAISFAAFALQGGALVGDFVTDGGLRNFAVVLGSGGVVYAGLWMSIILYALALALTWSGTRPRTR